MKNVTIEIQASGETTATFQNAIEGLQRFIKEFINGYEDRRGVSHDIRQSAKIDKIMPLMVGSKEYMVEWVEVNWLGRNYITTRNLTDGELKIFGNLAYSAAQKAEKPLEALLQRLSHLCECQRLKKAEA